MLGRDIDRIRMSLPDPRDEISLRSDLTIEREKKFSVLKPLTTSEDVYVASKKESYFESIPKKYCPKGHIIYGNLDICCICLHQSEEKSSQKEEEESSSSSDSCCYITSACLDDLKIPRTCPEMKAMKILTKDYVLQSFSGRKDYIKYGRIAPKIVTAIRASTDYMEAWRKVYETLKKVSDTTMKGRYRESHQQYKSLVLGLEAEFLK